MIRAGICALILLACLLVGAGSSSATIRNVPSTYTTIQSAITAAAANDTVLIADGHYFERIRFKGQPLVVGSRYLIDANPAHIAATIIDADPGVLGIADTGCVVRFAPFEPAESRLVGVTLQKGTGVPFDVPGVGTRKGGGGIFCRLADPTIDHCRILSCTADYGSGILANQGATATVKRCDIQGDVAAIDGTFLALMDSTTAGAAKLVEGGFLVLQAATTGAIDANDNCYVRMLPRCTVTSLLVNDSTVIQVDSSVITGRLTLRDDSWGTATACTIGGITIDSCPEVMDFEVTQCLVTAGSSAKDGGLRFSQCTLLEGLTGFDAAITVDSSIIYLPVGGKIIRCDDTVFTAFQAQCSNFYGYTGPDWFACANILLQTDNVIFTNPYFCDAAAANYHLADSSACIPSKNACNVQIGVFGVGCGCCVGTRGNVDNTGIVDLGDLSYLVDYLSPPLGPAILCSGEGNVDGQGIIDLGDLSHLVDYLSPPAGPALPACF